ncbi:MAG: hypothetical protein GY851_11155, partial [bacterium]|nr:hypothetical protein [bacterium]
MRHKRCDSMLWLAVVMLVPLAVGCQTTSGITVIDSKGVTQQVTPEEIE